MNVQIKTQWEIDPRALPTVANQVLLRPAAALGGGPSLGVQVTFGYVSSPAIGPDLSPEQMNELQAPVVVVGDFYLPTDAVQTLHQSLGEVLAGLSQEMPNG